MGNKMLQRAADCHGTHRAHFAQCCHWQSALGWHAANKTTKQDVSGAMLGAKQKFDIMP